jgi:MFS family permease
MNVFRQLRELPRSVRVLFAATLINRSGTMVLPYLALYMTQELGAGAEAAGTVLAAYGVGAIVAPMLAGWLADRFGALRVMRGSLLGSGVILLGYPLAPHHLSTLVALTFALSLVAEGFRPASLAVVADSVPAAQRKAAFTVLRFAINLGMSIGPTVGGLLAATSFQALFYIDGATSIGAGALLAVVRWSDAAARATPSTDNAVDGPLAGSSSFSSSSAGPIEPPSAATQSGRGAFARFLVAAFLLALVFFQFESSLPLFIVREVHSTEAFYGSLIGLNALIIIFTEIPLNLKMTAWPHPRSMALGTCFCAVGFGMLAFGKNLPLVVASVPLWTLGEMIVLPATSAFVSDLAPPGRSGAYMGLYTTAFGLGFAVGPFVGIYALEHFGSRILWTGAFVVGAVAAALFAGLPGAPSEPHVETQIGDDLGRGER